MEKTKTPKKAARKPAKRKQKVVQSKPLVLDGEIVPVPKVKPLNSGKKSGTLSAKTKKAIELCATTGITPKDAYTLANGHPPTPAAATRLKQQVEKYSLQRPSMQKLAANVVQDVLKGKERTYTTQKMGRDGTVVDVEETLVPSHTNQLAAAAMVYDRVEPIIRMNQNLNVNVDCPVDLSKYLNREG